MAGENPSIVSQIGSNLAAYLPAVVGAVLVLIVGWIVGRLLGKAVRIFIDKVTGIPMIGDSDIGKSVTKSGFSLGYLGDFTVRLIVYLIAVLAAVDILNMEYLSQFMTKVVEYIPHVVGFVVILVVGIILSDYFIDFFQLYAKNSSIELANPVLLLLRIFLYFVVVTLALSQLMLDLTIIYTLVTPIAWGICIGLGASIAIVVYYGMRNRSEQFVDKLVEVISK